LNDVVRIALVHEETPRERPHAGGERDEFVRVEAVTQWVASAIDARRQATHSRIDRDGARRSADAYFSATRIAGADGPPSPSIFTVARATRSVSDRASTTYVPGTRNGAPAKSPSPLRPTGASQTI